MNANIEERLVSIERLLLGQKNVLTFDEGCEFTGLSKTYMYKLTHQNKIPSLSHMERIFILVGRN
jgi:hypothetical protein